MENGIKQLWKQNPLQEECYAYYFYNNEEKHAFELIEDNQSEDLGENVFALQASMSPEHKWNKAIYTLEKDGYFDMTFEWDQTLQDEWDNAQD